MPSRGFEKEGGKVSKQLTVPFPNVEFQALLTEIAAARPDAVFAFFAGAGAVKFVKDYHAAGLHKTIPLYGSGFLTDGTLEAQGEAAQGVLTTLHYADELGTERDRRFRSAYAQAYKLMPDVYAVQGYDAAQMLGVGLKAAGGDIAKKAEFRQAIEKATIPSPRGDFTISKSHNPVQDMYLRKVVGKENQRMGVAIKALGDTGRGCHVRRGAHSYGRIRTHTDIAMDLATFLVQCLNAVQYGLLLFLLASGLTLIFGIMGVINLAHGSFYMIGAYMAFALSPLLGQHFITMLLAGVALTVVLGYALEWAFFSYLYEREHLQQVLMTFGLILVFEELRSLLAGNDVHGVPLPGWLSGSFSLGGLMSYPWYRLFASGVCLLVALALYWVVHRTRLGMMVRAGASNRDMVRGLGIDVKRLYRIVFAIGVALAALAGMIAAPMSSVYPGMGGNVLIICFVVVVIGGIGSITGALLASLLVGFVDTFGKLFFQELSGMSVYLLMAVVLVWRPQGLMGQRS